MAGSLTITGHVGEVRYGYNRAALLTAWTFTGSSRGGVITARLQDTDTFRLSQAPLRVVLTVGQSLMRWPLLSLQIEGASLTATVGEKE